MHTDIFSLISPSYIIVPNREIANSNISTYTSAMSYLVESKVDSDDIQIGASRGRSNVASTNLSRESSVLFKASSVEYIAYIKVHSTNFNWANQTEEKLFKLSYVMPIEREFNVYGQTNHLDSMPSSYIGHAYNIQS